MDIHDTDPALDLVLARDVPLPRAKVWEAWTTPHLIRQWFCPKPWMVSQCEIDVRPGGRFHTVMKGPEGQEMNNTGCILQAVAEELLVFTDCLGPDFRPAAKPFFTGIILLTDAPGGTHYKAIARHGTEEAARTHAGMGFEQGWGTALDQLVALMTKGKVP